MENNEQNPGNITTEPWDESLFDCKLNDHGQRKFDVMAWRLQGNKARTPKEPLSINEAEEEYPIEIIGQGAERLVVKPPESWWDENTGCVVKVQWNQKSGQTYNEIRVWEDAPGGLAALLAPILQHSEFYEWVVMPEAKGYESFKPGKRKSVARALRSKMNSLGYRARDVSSANIGRIEGRDVIVDYGTF